MTFVVIAFFCGLSAGVIGRMKGMSFVLWFLIGACLPLIGTLAAVLYRVESNEPTRECPECGRTVGLADQVCMSCGRDLAYPVD